MMYGEYTLDSSKSSTTASRRRRKKRMVILNDRSEEENRTKRKASKKTSRHFVDAARQVITRRVRKFFEIWQRRMKLREAYRFTKFKQKRRVVRNAVVTMVSRKRFDALLKIDRSLRRVIVRDAITHWIRMTQYFRTQMNRAKVIHKAMSRKRVLKRMRRFAKRRSETRCAAAIVCQLHQRHVLSRVLVAARLHYKFRIANEIAKRERKRRAVRTMKLERIRGDVNRRRKRVRFEAWKAYVDDMRIQKVADVFWARRAAMKTLQILKDNVVRERQMRDATQWYRMRSKYRALLSWQNATHESVLSRRANSFWIASRVQTMMNRWKAKIKQRRIVRECAIETIRVRRLVTLRLWRTRTERRVTLRRALRMWRHGVSGAALFVLSTMKARRLRRRDVLIHIDRLVVRNLRDSTRAAFSRWKSCTYYDRKRRLFLLSTTFWWWDQYVVESRLNRYFSNQQQQQHVKSTPVERSKRKRYTEAISKLSPILEIK
mgnify:CR=1 FL=1